VAERTRGWLERCADGAATTSATNARNQIFTLQE